MPLAAVFVAPFGAWTVDVMTMTVGCAPDPSGVDVTTMVVISVVGAACEAVMTCVVSGLGAGVGVVKGAGGADEGGGGGALETAGGGADEAGGGGGGAEDGGGGFDDGAGGGSLEGGGWLTAGGAGLEAGGAVAVALLDMVTTRRGWRCQEVKRAERADGKQGRRRARWRHKRRWMGPRRSPWRRLASGGG